MSGGSAARTHQGGLSGRSRRAGGVAAAVTGLALLAACGTTQAGSAAPATARATGSSTSPAIDTPAATSTPSSAVIPTTAPVLVPLVLPSAGRIAGPVTGSVSGVVTLGLNRCLFLRTDAGQRFGLEGSLAEQVRTLMIGRGVPVPQAHRSAQGHSAPTDLPEMAAVRIVAHGTVTTGASVCSSAYQFIAASGTVVSAVSTTP